MKTDGRGDLAHGLQLAKPCPRACWDLTIVTGPEATEGSCGRPWGKWASSFKASAPGELFLGFWITKTSILQHQRAGSFARKQGSEWCGVSGWSVLSRYNQMSPFQVSLFSSFPVNALTTHETLGKAVSLYWTFLFDFLNHSSLGW